MKFYEEMLQQDLEKVALEYIKKIKAGRLAYIFLQYIFSLCIAAAQRVGKEDEFKDRMIKDCENIIDDLLVAFKTTKERD